MDDLSEQQVVAPYFSFKIKERERKVRTPFRHKAGIEIVANSDGEKAHDLTCCVIRLTDGTAKS